MPIMPQVPDVKMPEIQNKPESQEGTEEDKENENK